MQNRYITNQALNYARQDQQQQQQQQQQIYQRTYQQTTPPVSFPIFVKDLLPGVNHGQITDYYRVPQEHVGTYLMQLPITDISKALEIFSFPHPSPCVPLILLPSMGLLEYFTFIPHGVSAIVTSFGSIVGEYSSGFQWMPIGRRVKFIVNKNFIPYDYPIKLCPTLDNVMVKIDTLVVFYIEKAVDFVVNLGPYKLNVLLSSFLEESIRSLARTVSYDEIYNIRGSNLESMVRSLTEKVKAYGIAVSSITITNVLLPDELQNSLQKTTKFESLQRCKDKEHVFNSMKLENQQYRNIIYVNRQNEKEALAEDAKKAIMLIQKENDELSSMIEKQIAELNCAAEIEAYKILLQGKLEEAKLQGEKFKTLDIVKAQGKLKAELVKADQDIYVMQRGSEAQLAVAQNTSTAVMSIAEAEAKCSKALRDKRLFALRSKQLAILESLSKNKGLVISGSNDYSVFAQVGDNKALPIAPSK